MSLVVGRAMGLEEERLKTLELGALFHDIGKIGIPSDILRKPGPLTDEEFEIVKEHPELGEKILAPIERLSDVRPIIRACHERWDGLGYPDGKAGDDIGWALWAADKLLAAQLGAPGRNLTRQSFVSSVNGKSFTTGVYPPVNYATSRFGGTGVHVVQLNCSDTNSPYENEANFKTGF